MADIVLPSLVLNDDDGPGIDDDHSVSDGEAADLAQSMSSSSSSSNVASSSSSTSNATSSSSSSSMS